MDPGSPLLFCPKNFGLKKNLGPNSISGPKNSEFQKLIGQKCLVSKKSLFQKRFTLKIFWVQNKYKVNKNVGSKKDFGPEKILSAK